MSQYKATKGHYMVLLTVNKLITPRTVSRMVAQAFISNPKNLPEVNHKDFNKANNCVDNLEWISRGDNIKHYVARRMFYGSENRFNKTRKWFVSRVVVNNKKHYLGSYNTREEGHIAYIMAILLFKLPSKYLEY